MMGAKNGTPEDGHKKRREKKARAADGAMLAEVIFSGEPVTKAQKKGKGGKDHHEGMFTRVTCTTATLLSDLPTDVEDPSADGAAPGMFERVMHNWTLLSDLPDRCGGPICR